MDFNNKLPDWQNAGTEPSEELKTNGFQAGHKPAAGVFNWFWSIVSKAISEMQSKISNVDNTADSEKHVAFASEAGTGRKVKYPLTVRFNGGDTESTDKWTYDGSTSRSINITPEKIGAAETKSLDSKVDKTEGLGLMGFGSRSDSVKDWETIVMMDSMSGTPQMKNIPAYFSDLENDMVVAATSTDGISYTATVNEITELYEGLEITICPDLTNTSSNMTLNVNNLGAKPIKRPLSFSTYANNYAESGFLHKDAPCRLMYHANYPNLVNGVSGKGVWLMADKVEVSAQDLYGTVPIGSGGTGGSTVTEALANLGLTYAPCTKFGSYVGSGKHGSGYPNTISCDFDIDCVIMLARFDGTTVYNGATLNRNIMIADLLTEEYALNIGFNGGGDTTSSYYGKRVGTNTIRWYSVGGATEQCNTENHTYFYLIIGHRGETS